MIKICLCDDIPVQLLMLEDIVRDFNEETEYDLNISTFESGNALLEDVKKNGFFDIYVLDMIMPGIKGIDIAKELRKQGDAGKIIYLTATAEYAVDSYAVGAFFYLLKPLNRKTMYSILERACSEINHERVSALSKDINQNSLEVKTKDGTTLIKLRNLLYVNIENRALCYHMIDGTTLRTSMLRVPFSEAVREITEQKGFLLAGSHLVVNTVNISQVTVSSIRFSNEEVLYPSKNALIDLSEQIKNLT